MSWVPEFSDGASDYVIGDILKVWSAGGAGAIGVSPIDGGTIEGPSALVKSGLFNSASRITGFRIKFNSVGGSATFFSIRGTSDVHVFLRRKADASIELLGEGFAVLAADPTLVLATGTWYTFEFGVLISGTVGRIEVRVDGTQIPAMTSIALGGSITNSLDTLNAAAVTNATSISLDGGATYDIDWIWTKYETAGAVWAASDFLGNVTKITRRAKASTAGNGHYITGTGWSVGAGGPLIPDAVRETTQDGDASYAIRAVASGTDADRFSVIPEAMPSNTATVKWLSHRAWVRNTTGSTSTHKRFLYESTGATTHDSAVTVTDGTSYAHGQDNFTLHPNGAALTKALVDSSELGLKVVTLT